MTMKSVGLLLISLLLVYPLYLWLSYIDETTVSGSAWGLEIGRSKYEIYKMLPLALSKIKKESESIFIQVKSNDELAPYVATDPDFDVMLRPLFHEIGYESFAAKDNWEFYVNASFTNVLKLEFCEGKLCKIHRHRKYFELP